MLAARKVAHSKALSYILRHGAAKEHLKIRDDGFILVEDIVWPSQAWLLTKDTDERTAATAKTKGSRLGRVKSHSPK